MTSKKIVHLAVYDTFVDWETGFATAHINKPLWHLHPGTLQVQTVGAGNEPIRTMGGMRVLPDLRLDDLRPANSAMLILSGNDIWDTDAFTPFAEKARDFLADGVPVAAICGATGGLARHGILDGRAHTSNAAAFLEPLEGYHGADDYVDEPAVDDNGLITGSARQPVEFARAILGCLGVFDPSVLRSWYKLYGEQNPDGFFELMRAS